MLSRMPIRLGAALLLTSAMLQSCAHVPERSASVSSNDVVTIESPEMGDLSRGDIVELKDGVLASFGEVRIGREYFSASGRLCKEILNATGRRVVSIACLFDDQNRFITISKMPTRWMPGMNWLCLLVYRCQGSEL